MVSENRHGSRYRLMTILEYRFSQKIRGDHLTSSYFLSNITKVGVGMRTPSTKRVVSKAQILLRLFKGNLIVFCVLGNNYL